MDTLKEYIKMIYEAWDDLEPLWIPKPLDRVARWGTYEQVLEDFNGSDLMVIKDVDNKNIYLYHWQTTFKRNKKGFNKLIPIFRQDQLQEMLEGSHIEKCGRVYRAVEKMELYPSNSMEQLWLIFVMKEKFNKRWDGIRKVWVTLK